PELRSNLLRTDADASRARCEGCIDRIGWGLRARCRSSQRPRNTSHLVVGSDGVASMYERSRRHPRTSYAVAVQVIAVGLSTPSRTLRHLARPVAAALTRRWPPRSRLFLVGEGAGWSIDHDLEELGRGASRLGLWRGLDSAKGFRIRIGVDLEHFGLQTPSSRSEARTELRVPQHAFVVGSFQKDGVGWGEGREPKLIKGPDLLLDALRLLHAW